MPEPESVDPRDLRPGPIRNEELPAELLEQVAAIYEVIGPYLGTTLEQFEISFMRDASPDVEVVVWCSITAAWMAYHEKCLNGELLPDETEKQLISALIVVSTGVEDESKLGVSPEVGRDLLACWEGLTD